MTFLFYFQPFLLDGYFITQNERSMGHTDYVLVADDIVAVEEK